MTLHEKHFGTGILNLIKHLSTPINQWFINHHFTGDQSNVYQTSFFFAQSVVFQTFLCS